jgi:hypothetical protein
MRISDVRVIGGPTMLATADEVMALENELWARFPAGYHEYVTQLGEGVLGGSFVRIYPPWRIKNELQEWRRRIGKYWFWDARRKTLPKERAVECVIVGDTTSGDELVFHPGRPEQLFVLPRESEKVFAAGSNLMDSIDWMCNSGELVEPFGERNFEPFDSRLEKRDQTAGAVPGDLEGESLDDLIEVAKRWAERHEAKKKAKADLKEYVRKNQTAVLISESIEIAGKAPHMPGYVAVFQVIGKASKNEAGILRWHMNDDSCGHEYMPSKSP